MITTSAVTTTALALAGVGLWAYAGGQLETAGRFDQQPNPLGLKRSPYGQVLAMAIQAPIDADWHGGIEIHDLPAGGEHDHECGLEDCEHEHDLHAPLAESECKSPHGSHGHGTQHELLKSTVRHDTKCSDPECAHHHAEDSSTLPLLERLHLAVTRRTNPNPPTPGHRFYLRREVERKLRFAYELDPSHYANYNAYHLFLVYRELGTSGEDYASATRHAVAVADSTIRYCLAERNDPRPALTAASAAYNVLEIMISDGAHYTTQDMRKQLGVLDFCLNRHFKLLDSAVAAGSWSLLSEQRQSETLGRSQFTVKLRESAEKAILRLESQDSTTASHDPS